MSLDFISGIATLIVLASLAVMVVEGWKHFIRETIETFTDR